MRGKSRISANAQRQTARFNEARALCAGSMPSTYSGDKTQYRFNEARALCAGSSQATRSLLIYLRASMRPAHYAREVDAPTTQPTSIEPLQ